MRRDNKWMSSAARKGLPLAAFYPVSDKGSIGEEAADACESCMVRTQCLRYALDNAEEGVWGGTTEEQRRVIRRNELRREATRRNRDGEAA